MCHVTKTIKINNHKQKLKGCTLIKRLLLAANYNTMISQPLPRVFSFHKMAKAGKENQYGFSVLPAAARLENVGAKLGGRQLHISHIAPCLRKHCFQFLLGKLQYPEEIKNKVFVIVFFCGGGGGEGGEQTRCIMGDVLRTNSFHLNRGTPSRTYRARSIQPKFQPVRSGKVDHLKRWTRFFETFPVGPNRSFEFWTEISGNFG